MRLRLLRYALAFSAITWLVAWVGVVVPWDTAMAMLHRLGGGPIAYHPMLDYWLRMTAGAFGLLGVWYAVLAWRQARYADSIPWFGWLMLVEGGILLGHGLRLRLGAFPFAFDAAACLLTGAAIVYLAPAARSRLRRN